MLKFTLLANVNLYMSTKIVAHYNRRDGHNTYPTSSDQVH